MKTANEIRQDFLDFFEKSHSHKIVSSASLLPVDDPTLMFTNAGMNQFKDYFLGRVVPDDKRVADSQKIMRVSGKHNDLDEVGRDGTHHTFFEMLGNWSFGDYYKKEAITMAWDLLTNVWKIPKDKLWVTVFKAEDADSVPSDIDAINFWKSETDVDPSHIVQLGKKDNFWSMGDTGPCGPCSEIHFNLTDKKEFTDIHAALDSTDFVEIWNLVFIQFNQRADGVLEELPSKHVDTGMGLERITSVLQKKSSNYDTDLFSPIIAKTEELSGVRYDKDEKGTPFRVIADHCRAISFTIADGVVPGNTGRGYVVRKILRRAARFGRELGLNEPFLFKLVPTLCDFMGGSYPELISAKDRIIDTIHGEESRFQKTLDQGLVVFAEMAEKMIAANKKIFSGQDAFVLHDRCGFPFDLTEVMVVERGWKIDKIEYDRLLEDARKKARGSGNFTVDLSKIGNDDEAWTKVLAQPYEFVGYQSPSVKTAIVEYTKTAEGQYLIVLSKNPFYINGGGQVGDIGRLIGDKCEFDVLDALKIGERKVILAEVVEGEFDAKGLFDASVDKSRREAIQRHHSATHLLHSALKMVLGNVVDQKGSMVDDKRLRFDFSYSKALTKDELAKVEIIVNEEIRKNTCMSVDHMGIDDARKSGAMALFSEKYEDVVRVVSAGDFSKELCGGTHVSRLGDIGFFKILKEESSAAGIRRIEAVAGHAAEAFVNSEESLLGKISDFLRCKNHDMILEQLQKIVDENKVYQKQLKELKSQSASSEIENVLSEVQEINGIKVLCYVFNGLGVDEVMQNVDTLKSSLKSVAMYFVSNIDDKLSIVVALTDDLVKKGLNAGALLKDASVVLNGRGGGRPNLAKGGGENPDKIKHAFEAFVEKIKSI